MCGRIQRGDIRKSRRAGGVVAGGGELQRAPSFSLASHSRLMLHELMGSANSMVQIKHCAPRRCSYACSAVPVTRPLSTPLPLTRVSMPTTLACPCPALPAPRPSPTQYTH